MAATNQYLGVDMRGWSAALRMLAEDVLPSAAKEVVNAAAFRALRDMPVALSESLDRPNPFTMRAFTVERAKTNSDLSQISSRLYVKGTQSAYLQYVLFGGTRSGGSYGAWSHDVPVTPEAHEDRYGGRPKSLLAKIQQAIEQERGLRGHGITRLLRQGKFEGYFFGRIGGVLGYWRRPARKVLSGPKKRGVRRSFNLSVPDLQIAIEKSTHHKPIFRGAYDRVVNEAQALAVAEFPKILADQIGRKISRGSKKYSGLRKPDFLK